ncbi:uncharacterized protein BYT42DRAFT_559147 [Radiomyces spectabilis]|uniref:uncharacterized protein n=1 Tax=Radiomyces spectabilis TaxID=64574 RepID=UPI0022210B9D|nr:uncharacterized protein BYT42DRAFT_559147 [Radiomyces spectabilis]KAI8388166.1 hypothetical protein BYT42DRAFT_559147 [Radiomyces spectabilis]
MIRKNDTMHSPSFDDFSIDESLLFDLPDGLPVTTAHNRSSTATQLTKHSQSPSFDEFSVDETCLQYLPDVPLQTEGLDSDNRSPSFGDFSIDEAMLLDLPDESLQLTPTSYPTETYTDPLQLTSVINNGNNATTTGSPIDPQRLCSSVKTDLCAPIDQQRNDLTDRLPEAQEDEEIVFISDSFNLLASQNDDSNNTQNHQSSPAPLHSQPPSSDKAEPVSTAEGNQITVISSDTAPSQASSHHDISSPIPHMTHSSSKVVSSEICIQVPNSSQPSSLAEYDERSSPFIPHFRSRRGLRIEDESDDEPLMSQPIVVSARRRRNNVPDRSPYFDNSASQSTEGTIRHGQRYVDEAGTSLANPFLDIEAQRSDDDCSTGDDDDDNGEHHGLDSVDNSFIDDGSFDSPRYERSDLSAATPTRPDMFAIYQTSLVRGGGSDGSPLPSASRTKRTWMDRLDLAKWENMGSQEDNEDDDDDEEHYLQTDNEAASADDHIEEDSGSVNERSAGVYNSVIFESDDDFM